MSMRYSARVWAAAICLLACVVFVLLQGGKVSSLLLFSVCVLFLYVILGRFSGVRSAYGERTLSGIGHEAVSAGTRIGVNLDVSVPGLWPIPYLTVRDRLIRQDGEEWLFENAAATDWNRSAHVSYFTPPLRRGRYRFAESQVAVSDVFGLFSHEGILRSEQSFSVLPQTVHIKDWRRLDQAVRGQLQHTAATQAVRETTQINGVREYIYGDKLSRIHWNATAKTGTWKSKEFEREARPKTVLVLDRSAGSYPDEETFELAVSVAASIIDYGSQKDLSVGMVSSGSQSAVFEPRQSKGIHRTLTDHLISVEADGSHLLGTVLKERLSREFRGCFVVLITPVQSQKLLESMQWLEQRQMIPCHIHIGQDTFSKESWHRMLKRSGYTGYSIRRLDELPSALGGGSA
ncbi:DUF58 domain-containing protein [Paenibacillus gansuensis]|uniref:DUF58 domain-containing protein n=1 Tax=Paenibacillus gansuensis TaxID=306542 RepID=A0ABW5PCK4_9BACL